MPKHFWKLYVRNGYWAIDHFIDGKRGTVGNSIILNGSEATARAVTDALNNSYDYGYRHGCEQTINDINKSTDD